MQCCNLDRRIGHCIPNEERDIVSTFTAPSAFPTNDDTRLADRSFGSASYRSWMSVFSQFTPLKEAALAMVTVCWTSCGRCLRLQQPVSP